MVGSAILVPIPLPAKKLICPSALNVTFPPSTKPPPASNSLCEFIFSRTIVPAASIVIPAAEIHDKNC